MSKLRVLVEEEWGYMHYLWTYHGSKAQLIEDWLNHKWPRGKDTENRVVLAKQRGPAITVELIDVPELNVEHDAKCHWHTDEDSWLEIDGQIYSGNEREKRYIADLDP